MTAAKFDGNTLLQDTFENTSIINGPGEFNYTTVKSVNIASVPVGKRIKITVDANASGHPSNQTVGVAIEYDGITRLSMGLGSYYTSASRTWTITKKVGVNTINLRYRGSSNIAVGGYTASCMQCL